MTLRTTSLNKCLPFKEAGSDQEVATPTQSTLGVSGQAHREDVHDVSFCSSPNWLNIFVYELQA